MLFIVCIKSYFLFIQDLIEFINLIFCGMLCCQGSESCFNDFSCFKKLLNVQATKQETASRIKNVIYKLATKKKLQKKPNGMIYFPEAQVSIPGDVE